MFQIENAFLRNVTFRVIYVINYCYINFVDYVIYNMILFEYFLQLEITCLSSQYECYNGTCIPDSWICDGYYDCAFGEDEYNCSK